jgi:tetratricopeptide (TPR) repeat protein
MAKLARLPRIRRAPETADAADPRHRPRLRTRYYAFLSYSHKDRELADWLHRELERFRVPSALAGKLTANGVVPRRLTPIFRDQHDLPAGDDLAVEIEAALAASQFLVVLCSPTAAKSRWTNLEIESFKRTRPEGCVLAAVVAGEPFASDIKGREDDECFPPALRYKYDRRGRQTSKRAEPLAADFRAAGEGKRLAFLKLVAGMLGVGLDELVQRATTRRHRQLAYVAAASLTGMAVTSTLAVTAFQSRNEAREQRREAEGLVEFMLGDLKDKLEPIGRLDALDGVGSRVLAYYSKQDTSELSDAALLQRSRALSLMAQVANARGDTQGAVRLYREAMAGTAETIRRNPDDPQALFDHAQNVFYVGEIAQQHGDVRTAEASMRDYKRLALRMVSLGPDNMKWRMEEQYAEFNLGIILYDQRQFGEAVAQFSDSLKTIKAISTADPTNKDYRVEIGESLAWLADAQTALGRYDEALATRQEDISVLEGLLGASGDVNFRQRLSPAHRALGLLYVYRGQRELAIEQFRAAMAYADGLIAVEPNNAQWLLSAVAARIDLARELLNGGRAGQATAHVDFVCNAVNRLLARDPRKPDVRNALANCWALRARLALAEDQKAQALEFATRAATVQRSVHTADAATDAYYLAETYWLLGNIHRQLGNGDAARSAWTTALASMPAGTTETPNEIALRASILERLGRRLEAEPLVRRLDQIGFKDPELRNA